MAHFHIEGLAPYDGDWPADLTRFTNREFHTIKEMSGVRAGELDEAFKKGDNDVLVAFTVIMLERAGKQVNRDVIWDAPAGTVTLVPDAEDVEESPPAQPPPEPGGKADGAEKNGSSGVPSRIAGEDLQASLQSSTGSPDSDTTSPSVPATSAI